MECESARGVRDLAAGHVIRIVFDPLEPVRAEGPDGFICYRRPFEDRDAFEDRAANEVLAVHDRRYPPPILVFMPAADNPTESVATA